MKNIQYCSLFNFVHQRIGNIIQELHNSMNFTSIKEKFYIILTKQYNLKIWVHNL